MHKLTTFIQTFWKSIASLTYYHDVVKARFSFSLKYFLFFSLLLGLLLTGILSSLVIPPVQKFVNRFEARVAALYPQDLVISVKNGELSTNVTEPLRFPIPFELFTDTPGAVSDQNQQYLLTIDTKAEVSSYPESKSIILATKDTLVVPDDNGGYTAYPLKEAEDMTIDKAFVDTNVSLAQPFLRLLPVLLVIGIFIVLTIFLPLIRLISLMVLTVCMLLFARLLKVSLSYGKLYQIGLHALTLPTLIQIFMVSFDLNVPIPFFNSILYLLYGLVILAELKKPTETRARKR